MASESLTALRARLSGLEAQPGAVPVVPLGVPALDAQLPGGGLARGAVHQIEGGEPGAAEGAATAFTAVLAGRLAAEGRPVLWIEAGGGAPLHPPGLAGFGLGPERLLRLSAGSRLEVQWALEEALRCPDLAAAVAEMDRLDLTAARRLQLAAKASAPERRPAALVLIRPRRLPDLLALPARDAAGPTATGAPAWVPPPSAASTAWRISALPASPPFLPDGTPLPGLGRPRWAVALIRCRGGRPGRWVLDWDGSSLGDAEAPPLRWRHSA